MQLHDLKNFDAQRMDIDQLVALAAFGRSVRTEYEQLNLEEPTWLDDRLKSLRREIAVRNTDRIEAMLKEKKTRLDALKTPNERKTELKKQIKELEEQLAEV